VSSSAGLALQRARQLTRRFIRPGPVSSDWNRWNLLREVAWYGVLSGVTTTFTSVYALRYGASDLHIGLLSSLPALANVIFQIPAARLVERQSQRRSIVLISGLLMRLPALFLAFVPWLPAGLRGASTVWISFLGMIPAALGVVSFTALLAEVVSPQERARVVSMRNALLAAATTISVGVAGESLERLPFPFSYQLIFVLAFLSSLVSLFYLGRVVTPWVERPPRAKSHSVPRPSPVRTLRAILSHREYTAFTVGAFVYHWGLHFPIPLYPIFRVRVLGLSESWIGTLAMLESAVTIISYYAWGRVAQRRGSRPVLLLGVLLVCAYPMGMALSRSCWSLLPVVIVAAIAGPAFNLGLFNGLLDVAPAQRRTTYVAAFNTLMNVAAFISPLLGTTAASWLGVRQALWIGGAARVVGFVVFSWLWLRPSAVGRAQGAAGTDFG
jgi:MFS family permease